ncbi:uncharacterized protein At3g17950-like [Cynara cardunculus var. scolymus]|uniref:Uncharacterized protein n=1 Tax=Cynara cardunculus var. scolymus TaxID=59895 RepID=A0A103YMW9_CYNCS|nr:uncharacterized protein At3g17950-like [Cynara cardunculus var. scolymus]KVI11962.1 hypothetical protein Ccrd_009622 [Cynara cardunculus var. scolymus]
MAQQEEGGWPLGLQPLNVRARNHDFSGSISCNTLLSGSPTLTSDSSSDLDTQSTGSFFHDKSITLGNLLGVSSIIELSRRSLRGGRRVLSETITLGNNRRSNPKPKTWCFNLCLCPRDNVEVDIARNNTVPLGHFLEVERRTAHEQRRGHHGPLIYGPDEIALAQPFGELSNSLFVDGRIAPPTHSSPWSGSESNGRKEGRRKRTPCF